METLRPVIKFFASISLIITLVTYYLQWNKVWGVRHERPVAASISLSSNLIALVALVLASLNLIMERAWIPLVEYALSIVSMVYFAVIGAGWWVEGQRKKGLWRLVRESLRNERAHLGDLARSILHPASAGELVDVLVAFALLDDTLDDGERAFVDTFAVAWGVRIDWPSVLARPRGSREERLSGLRATTERYLATSPPTAQAGQVSDVLRKLSTADRGTSPEEEIMLAELTGLLDRYLGNRNAPLFEVHLVPQSDAQRQAMEAAFPGFEQRSLPSGPVFVAGAYFSRGYAELIRKRYVTLSFYTAVTEVGALDPLRPPG